MTPAGHARSLAMRHVALMVVAALAFSLAGCALSPQTSGVKSSGESAVSAGAAATAPNSTAPELTAQDAARASMPGVPAPTGTGGDASKVPPAQKLIVRNKTMRMETADVPGTITRIRDLVKRDGADISQLQVATALDEPIYRPAEGAGAASGGSSPALKAFITIRVPADRYQAFIDDAAKLGDVKFQTESADDVTQQHIDLKARLDNLRSEEAQLRQFFLKAKNVGEMLQIETELGRVRGEIESLAAQVAYLERQAAMATVTIELTEPKALVRPAGIDWGVGSAFTQSVRAFVSTMNVLIIVLGPVLALLVFLGLPAALVLWVVVRRLKKRRAKAAEATGTAPGAPAGNTDATDQRARG